MTSCLLTFGIIVAGAGSPDTRPVDDPAAVIIVVGAAGADVYGRAFAECARRWQSAAGAGRTCVLTIAPGSTTEVPDRERLRLALDEHDPTGDSELWLVMIGHGTFDGRTAKFNLRGPDVSAAELAGWLAPYERPVVVINCSSASGPFLKSLSGPNRVIVTATKSGQERNYSRFGDYLSHAIDDAAADLDKDGQTSLLEAWLAASRRTEESYRLEGRLATEHALLDDNGDSLGTRDNWFRGVRPIRESKTGQPADGLRAHQICLMPSEAERRLPPHLRRKRNELELAIFELHPQKAVLPEEEYFRRLEALLIPLAELYEQVAGLER